MQIMKTWFCKDTQKWVSEIPRAFWLGIRDYRTNEKIYSDDSYVMKYICSYDTNWELDWEEPEDSPMDDCRRFYVKFKIYPGINRINNYIFKKL